MRGRAEQACQSWGFSFMCSVTARRLSPAIFVAVLVWSPVSGLLEFQPREATVERASVSKDRVKSKCWRL